MYASLGRKK